jgi:hypothetical protein
MQYALEFFTLTFTTAERASSFITENYNGFITRELFLPYSTDYYQYFR